MMVRMWRAAFRPNGEMYSPLTTSPRSTMPCRIQLFSTVTPVSIPAQAFEMSNVIAFVAPISRAIARLIVGSSR